MRLRNNASVVPVTPAQMPRDVEALEKVIEALGTGVGTELQAGEEFRTVTLTAGFAEGVGLSGRTWRARDLHFVRDTGEMTDCVRAPAAQRAASGPASASRRSSPAG
ncbi:MAG TPA: hypothetical protein VGO74_00100 [Modestobacter sp.]|nr:hypothetical protein [Modestobacter sp.]